MAKTQKKKEAETLRKEKEAERDQQRRARGPDAPFVGSLSSKNKPDLQEIAAALDAPLATVKSHLQRGLKLLRAKATNHLKEYIRGVGTQGRI